MSALISRKAQLLSVDFLVAVSLLTLCIGVLLQANEFSHSRADSAAFLADNKAEAIASFLRAGEAPAFLRENAVFCARRVLAGGGVQGVEGAAGCESFSCARSVFSTRRIESCVPSPTPPLPTPPAPSPTPVACVLEVRAC